MRKSAYSNKPCPKDLIDKTFERWCVNLDELCRQYPRDNNLRTLAQGLTEAFAAIFTAIEDDDIVGLIVARQSKLPDFESSDDAYADDPF